jgi:hypothetical protein
MNTTHRRIFRLWITGFAALGFGSQVGCISDDSSPPAETGGTGGSGTGGTSGTSGTGGGPSGTVCAAPLMVDAATPAIANFDDYDGMADLTLWSFPLGADPASGIFAGTFGYGDETDGFPEVFEMAEGRDSTYALSISDTLADAYGGGMGLWISECLDATAFSGLSFWVRGTSPTGTAKLTLLMQETTSSMPATGTSIGTCTGTDTTCVHPIYNFPVTDTWTEVRVAWAAVTPGNANGTRVVADGHNIWQIQFDVGLVWAPNEAGAYVPTPAPYDFAVDDMTFY